MVVVLVLYDRRNQESRDHKKNIDTYVSALKSWHIEMEYNHRQDGDCTEPIYISAILQLSRNSEVLFGSPTPTRS